MEEQAKFHPAFSKIGETIMGAFDRDLIYWHEARRNLGFAGLSLDAKADLPNFEPPTINEEYEPEWVDEGVDLGDLDLEESE